MAATGNVRYSQIRSGDRTGNGSRLVTAASGTLTQDVPLLYDANGNVVATATRSGNTTEFATVSGTKSTGQQLAFDASGNVIASGEAIGGGGVAGSLSAPDNADFTDLNSPSVVSALSYGIFIASTSTGSDNLRGRKKAIPTAPYTIEVGLIPQTLGANYRMVGFGLYDGTKLRTIGVIYNNVFILSIQSWTNVTTFSSSTDYGSLILANQIFFKLEDNNTNWIWSWGTGRDNMQVLRTETRNTHLTPTHFCFIVDNNTSGSQAAAYFNHLSES